MCFVSWHITVSPGAVLWGVLRVEWGTEPLAISYLAPEQELDLHHYNKSDLSPVGVGFCNECPLSLILFTLFKDRISRCGQEVEGVRFGGLRTVSLVLLASSSYVPSVMQRG